MNTKMLRVARQNYCRPYIPAHIQRHNIRAWVRSIRILGDKWVYARYVKLVPIETQFENN